MSVLRSGSHFDSGRRFVIQVHCEVSEGVVVGAGGDPLANETSLRALGNFDLFDWVRDVFKRLRRVDLELTLQFLPLFSLELPG